MSKKKYRFKKRRETQQNAETVHEAHSRKAEEIQDSSYNMKTDFMSLFVIIIFCTSLVVGLYYYDKSANFLSPMVDKILTLI